MVRNYSDCGIVINRVRFGEADKLITILSKKHGKVKFFAKGVRRIHSRKAPHLELFNFINFFVHLGKSIDILTEADTIESFANIRIRFGRIMQAYKLAEIIDRLCPEKVINENIFALLHKTLQLLNKKDDIDEHKVIHDFILETLQDLGFLPPKTTWTKASLDNYLEDIMEKKLFSNKLLAKIGKD